MPAPESTATQRRGPVIGGALAIGVLTLGLLFGASAEGQQAPASEEIDRVVAVVNDDVIVRSELDARLPRVRQEMRARGLPIPPEPKLERLVLDRLILERLQLELADRLGIRVRDEQLNRGISDIAKRNRLDLRTFRAILERDGVDFARFRERIRHELIIARLRQQQIRNRIRVRESEIARYLETEKAASTRISAYHLSHVLVPLPVDPPDSLVGARRALANSLAEALRNGESIAQIIRDNAAKGKNLTGGDLGWRTPGKLPSVFAEVVPSMKKGEVSDSIRSPSGFHVVKVLDVKRAQKTIVRQTHVQHILLRPGELLSENDAKARLAQLRERIVQGEDFGQLARATSDDRASAAKDGDLGWVNPGDLVPEFQQIMDSLQPGEVSKPFRTRFGWHIMRVLGRREHDSTAAVRRNKAREAIRARRMKEELEAWLAQLRDEAYVEYHLEE